MLSIVIPAKNEADNIAPLVAEIHQALGNEIRYEIVYVNDGSEDDTLARIQGLQNAGDTHLRVISHRVSTGQSTAVRTGVQHAKGEWICTMDADGQNAPSDIPNMLEQARQQTEGGHFCIAGYRKNRKDTAWKRFQSRFANRIRAALLKDGTPDTGCGLKIFPRHTFLELPYFDHMHRFIPALIRRLGGSIVIVEVHHRDRMAGTSNYTMLSRLWVGIVDMFGVMWLQRRAKLPELVTETDPSQ
ncbi:glycosyltransferase family 2 protein [Aestuariibacter halophilus]|uniref:Glycosyltransferase family 2 protein n=1 Tax=Fluctibacter halophilus TaxID=226011 RepID=A0ABS8G971_9ALTE|nr:glycosyltransferase family 2 protein [Aestuariibacter halophilus]MCC2617078.1 glycosyltransferase family 2 protein [Aestuariibacter halophilus]